MSALGAPNTLHPPAPAGSTAGALTPFGRPLWLTVLRVAAGFVAVLWSLVLTAWLILHWGILPRIDSFRPQIESRLSQALGVPLRIGAIEVRSSGWVPAISMRDVVLHDAQGREALRLPQVDAAVSARSLLSLQLRLEQLLIERADLDIRRDAAGRVFVAGIEMAGAAGDRSAADWFFRQREIVIRGARLRWIDEQRAAAPLQLNDVQLVIRNGLRQHDLRLDATPPAAWGERFSVRGRLTQPLFAPAGDWTRWSGTLFADLPAVDVRQLQQHASLPVALNEGRGALRGWLDVKRGQASAATIDVALADVDLQLDTTASPLRLTQAAGRVQAQRDAESILVSARRLSFVTSDGLRWQEGAIDLALRQAQDLSTFALADQPILGGTFSADHIDLGVAAQISTRLPISAALRKGLADNAPQGMARAVQARWDGPLEAPRSYRVQARLEATALAALPAAQAGGVGRPGWRNAALDLIATEQGGSATVAITKGALEFPGVFEEPLVPMADFAANLRWRVTPATTGHEAGLEVKADGVRFANDDARGELQAVWHTGGGQAASVDRSARLPGVLVLSGKLREGKATSVARYLPLGLARDARDYVKQAVLGGTVRDVAFKVKGNLSDFPFHRTGEFHIAGQVDDVTLAYAPDGVTGGPNPLSASGEPRWPVFTKVSGELVFDRLSMAIRDAKASVFGLDMTQVQGRIVNLEHDAVLEIDGGARGPLADGLRFVKASPVGAWIGHALDKASGTGLTELKLALNLPLTHTDKVTLTGSLGLAGNDVHLSPESPLLAGARGRIGFTQKGFTVSDASARVFGGETTFAGAMQPDGKVRISAQGSVNAEGLRAAKEIPALARLAQSLQGRAAYTLQLGIAAAGVEVNLASTLQGMAIDLPEPLRKSADTTLPLHFQTAFAVGAASASTPVDPRETMRFELGNIVQATYLRDLSGPAPRVLRGAIAVRDALPEPEQGVQANLRLERLDVDAWTAVARSLNASPSGATTAATAAADDESAAAGHGGSAASAYLPTRVVLSARELQAGSRKLSNVSADAQHTVSAADDVWSAKLHADQAEGRIDYRPARPGGAPARLSAALDRLSLPAAEADSVPSLLEQADTRSDARLPALDIVVNDFELRGKKLGRVEVQAASRLVGEGRDAAREWSVSRFSITLPEAQLNATGRWEAQPAGAGSAAAAAHRMLMDFKLNLDDSGALLERLGMGKVLRGGKGQLEGQVSWAGSPLALDVPSLGGQLRLSLDAGQFLTADPGSARLLGVLSLQSLPRRLSLDFRDLFEKGFAFDNATGNVAIERGVASSNNLRMRGAQAAVLMEGTADVQHETQDLRVIVVPQIDAGTAALAYAAINPAIGLGAFVAQFFLRRPLMEANTREFHVSGPWADPKVVRVQRKPGEAAPTIDAPAAAASSPSTPP